MKNTDFEENEFIFHNKLNINENNLDKEENDEEEQRLILKERWKNRTPYVLEGKMSDVISEFILSEGVEEDFETSLEDAPAKIFNIRFLKAKRQFKYQKKEVVEKSEQLVLKKEKLKEAIGAIYKFESKSKDILNEDVVTLLFSFDAPFKNDNLIDIKLVHPLIKNPDICIFVLDHKKKEYKEKLTKLLPQGGFKVIKLTSLCKRFQAFSEKKLLLGSYDLFLYDKELETSRMHALLGSIFKNSLPFSTSFDSLEEDLENSKKSIKLKFKLGAKNIELKVGRISMIENELFENLSHLLDSLHNYIQTKGLYSILIKSNTSPALQFYEKKTGKISKQFECEKKRKLGKEKVNKEKVSEKKSDWKKSDWKTNWRKEEINSKKIKGEYYKGGRSKKTKEKESLKMDKNK